MEGSPLGPGGEDITWPDQVAPRGRKASSTRKIKPQNSNLWRGPTGSSSIGRPFCAPSTGRSLLAPFPFPLCRAPGLIPWAVVRPRPIPHPVFIPWRAASNPVARAHWILIHPGTALCA